MAIMLSHWLSQVPILLVSHHPNSFLRLKQLLADYHFATVHSTAEAAAVLERRMLHVVIADSTLSPVELEGLRSEATKPGRHVSLILLSQDEQSQTPTGFHWNISSRSDNETILEALHSAIRSAFLVPLVSQMEARSASLGETERQLQHQNALLQAVSDAQGLYIMEGDANGAFDKVLKTILKLTGSAFGFIGQVLRTPTGIPYLKTFALTNIAWTDELRSFFEENAPKGLEFTNLNTLFGAVLKSGDLVIANDPSNDPRSGGLPAGHPPLKAFMGIPLYHGDSFVGMVGLANREGGYRPGDSAALSPLLVVSASLIASYQEQKKRTGELEKQRKRDVMLASILNSIIDALIVIDHKGIIQEFNPVAERFLGYSRAEAVGKNVNMLMSNPHAAAHDDYLMRYLRTGEKHIIGIGREVPVRRKDGSHAFAELAVSEMHIDDELFFIGVLRDLTEKKNAEKTLHESEQRFRVLAEAAFEAIVIHDNGLMVEVNRAATELFGFSREEMLGQPLFIIIPQEQHDIVRQRILRMSEETYETLGLKKSGETFDVEIQARYVPYQQGMFRVAAIRDISERKKIERLKNEFISTVSHELRTPLTAIVGSLGLLAGGALGELPQKAGELTRVAYKNSERLVLLINDILDIQRIEAGKMVYKYGRVDLRALVVHAATAHAGYAEKHNARITVGTMPEYAEVYGDYDRLMQVLANFLSNACKFSPDGGEVQIGIQNENGWLTVTVTDHGPGIPPEFHSRIFGRFAQADSSDTRKKGGTGLGLNIARAIVEKHGGKVAFRSEPHVETVFGFCLPPYESVTEDTDPGKCRCLILEEEPDVMVQTAEIARAEGLSVDTARSLDAAESLLSAHQYDVIITSSTLASCDIEKSFGLLCANQMHSSTPLVLLAAEDCLLLQDDAWQDRIVECIRKPPELKTLSPVLRRVTDPLIRHRAQVILVEDDRDNAMVLKEALRYTADVVTAGTVTEGLMLIETTKCDLLILDVSLPDGSGIDVLNRAREKWGDTVPVVLYTAYDVSRAMAGSVSEICIKSKVTSADVVGMVKRLLDEYRRNPDA